MVGDRDWISASDALDMVETRLGGRSLAKDTLAEMLRDGKIRARAAETWGSDINDMHAIWESEDPDMVAHDSEEEIQSDFRQSVQWADDVDSWIWPDSFFMITVSRRPTGCTYYRSVRFYLPDLLVLGGLDKASQTAKNNNANGGRRPDLQRWQNFWLEVVQIARDGKLVPGQIASQAALREDLLDAMKGNPLSEDSIKEPVRRIWQRFCED